VPVPATGVRIDAAQGVASVAADAVELSVRPSAWRGSPWDLRDYVTPFLVTLSNGAAAPLRYDYVDIRLFDDSRFQYTALPPEEVARILGWRSRGEERLAAVGAPPVIRRRVAPEPIWDPGWYPYGWYGWYYPGAPITGEIYTRALPMGPLQPGARMEGFVYFLRLRGTARSLTLEFHYQMGELRRVLTLPFRVERDGASTTDS
jgi:hypothetical protein